MSSQTEPRNINELLLLDTYQGMTDEEIELVIDFKARQRYYDLESTFDHAERIERLNEVAENNSRTREIVRSALEYAMSTVTRPMENDTEV